MKVTTSACISVCILQARGATLCCKLMPMKQGSLVQGSGLSGLVVAAVTATTKPSSHSSRLTVSSRLAVQLSIQQCGTAHDDITAAGVASENHGSPRPAAASPNVTLRRSRGFEGMAASPDKKYLYPMLEVSGCPGCVA
jgi:hypothetical protein